MGKNGSEDDQGVFECVGGRGGLTVYISKYMYLWGFGKVWGVCVCVGMGGCLVLLLHQQAIPKLSDLEPPLFCHSS